MPASVSVYNDSETARDLEAVLVPGLADFEAAAVAADALDFWHQGLGRHLMAAAGALVVETLPPGAACPRCGATHRKVHAFRAKAESKSTPVVACAACYSLVRAYPRAGRATPGRLNPANAALVRLPPHRSVLLADLAIQGPFDRRPESTGRTRFVCNLMRSLTPPYLLVFFGKNPGIQRALRVCRAEGAVEICGAEALRFGLPELLRIERALEESGLAWEEAASVMKLRAGLLRTDGRRRQDQARELARRLDGNRFSEALLERLPLPGTDLYRAVAWRAAAAEER